MGNLPSDQRRHIQDLAMRTGADLSDPNMADRIQKISELKFAAGQDLSRDDVLDRTSDFLRLRNATDDQISQVRDIYANNKVLPLVGNVEALWNVGKTANDATTRQRTFVGKYIDNAMVGTGNVLSTFGEYVESNPVAKYALEGLDIVTGPAAYALRNFTPVGDLINAAQSKVTGYISGGLQDVGRTDIDAQNGGIGGTAMLSVGAGGFAGMMKGVGSTLDIFKTKRLLPGEGNVATYGELIAAGSKGDNITPHHIPSAKHMSQYDISKNDGIAINMEQPVPGVGGRHRETFTYGTTADVDMTARGALATGVQDARKIYQNDGLYGPDIRKQLQELIRQNKATYPTIFEKK
ncbi:hypothetical protein DUGA2_63890 [Duganella sp. HH101]|nr:hypothetical protein DUGA2_63890 [Duganella sp. HH101]